jgi:hypothetical protein
MNKREKKRLARQMLKRHDYTDAEIAKILGYAFDKKKVRVSDDNNNRPESA